jgi:CYTH domain
MEEKRLRKFVIRSGELWRRTSDLSPRTCWPKPSKRRRRHASNIRRSMRPGMIVDKTVGKMGLTNNLRRQRRQSVEIAETVQKKESGRVRRRSNVEKEFVLMVDSTEPTATIERVSRLESLKDYSLRPSESLRLHDIYFETATRSLGRKRINLRLRKREDAWLITTKRSPGLLRWKRNERKELELPWSHESLDTILAELSANGVIFSKYQHFDIADPIETLKSIGLGILQDRETARLTHKVSSTPEARDNLAELASDCVTYHFQRRNVKLYELEVEAKRADSAKVLTDMKTELLNGFASELIPWKWGKLVTGKMIESLLKAGTLDNLIENDLLSKVGIEEVEKALRKGLLRTIFRQ